MLVPAGLKNSPLWAVFEIHRLAANVRAANDEEFSDWLLEIGNGEAATDIDGNIMLRHEILSSGNLVNDIFGTVLDPEDADEYIDFAILTPTNVKAIRISEKVLDLLPTEERIY